GAHRHQDDGAAAPHRKAIRLPVATAPTRHRDAGAARAPGGRMNTQWTPQQIDTAKDILARTPCDRYHSALAETTTTTRRVVTDNALRHAFKARGLGRPASYCTAPGAVVKPTANTGSQVTPAALAGATMQAEVAGLVAKLRAGGGKATWEGLCDDLDL